MRVLHVDCGREMRGGQWQVVRLIEGLRAKGVEAQLMCPADSALSTGVSGTIPFSLAGLRARWRRFDIVHAHDARSHSWCALVGVKPLIVSRRVMFPVRSGFLSRWKYSRAARFIAISQAVAKRLLEAGIPESRIAVVYDGVQDFDWQSDLTGEMIAPESADPQKGSDLLAASGAPVQFSTNLEMDLRTASGFVYLSRQEGLGSAILMAMSAGVPVVASNTGGIPEIVRHEETGLLVENTPAAIAEACRRITREPQLIRNAKQMVKDRFSIETMVNETLRVYGSTQ